jgi:hypothetical protein
MNEAETHAEPIDPALSAARRLPPANEYGSICP